MKQKPIWVEPGLLALTILFGMQSLRVLLPLFVFLLRDRMDWGTIQLGQLAFAVFSTGFLAALLRRLLGSRRLLLVTAGGLGLLRAVMQLWTGDPLGDLYLAIASTILFILFLPVCLGQVRAGGIPATGRLALGLLSGLALDVALHGAFSTYDLHWQAGLGPLLLILLLVLGQWSLLAFSLARSAEDNLQQGERGLGDGPLWPTLAWLVIGPLLFLQMLIFQNMARLSALTAWIQPLAFGWVLLSHAAGLAAAAWMLGQVRRGPGPLAVLLGLALFAALVPASPRGATAGVLFLVGQVSAAVLIAVILAGLGARGGINGLARTTIAHGIGMTLMVAFLFLYYSAYEIRLPFSNTILPPAAAVIMGFCAVGAALGLPGKPEATVTDWRPALLTLLLLVLPLVRLTSWRTPATVPGDGYPVRIMTFNMHNGFDMDGFLGMEAMAQVMEAQHADVIALQEISRGWVIAGSLDMLTWLSQRLGMPYVSGPTADPQWGNAILSRYPIVEYESRDLPPRDLPILRGFLWARIDLGANQRLDVLATHYHHIMQDSAIRVAQSQAILEFWDGRGPTALLGDLNAEPGDPEIEMLRQAGLADVLDLAGITPGYTRPADRPSRRIDYIWVTPDLAVSDVVITSGTVSDHLGVVATVDQ